MIKAILVSIAAIEGAQIALESLERHNAFKQAKDHADSLGMPLLVVGSPKFGFLHHPCGDVTIDINPDMARYCDTQIADVRHIPYSTQYFGAAFVSHVLEHLPTVNDAYKALEELHRVANKVFIVSPHKTSITAWIHPEHHLWVTHKDDDFIIEQRNRGGIKTESYITALSII